MGEPVLVIHGVSNRDPARFDALVDDLSRSVGNACDLIPAFWGDLGGNPVGTQDTIPDPSDSRVRGGHQADDESVAQALLTPVRAGLLGGAVVTRGGVGLGGRP